ncbi:MAG: Maf family nucleotide pyrophosphatase [Paracoccaceae bacterium]
MSHRIILASGSDIRAALLRNAGVTFDVEVPRIDEPAIRSSMQAEGASPQDIADVLAEHKARKIALKHSEAFVIGCDQVLDFGGRTLSKPVDPDDAKAQLRAMSGQRHSLLSAAVIWNEGAPVWRFVGQVRLQMRPVSDDYIDDYVIRNWDSIRHAVGCYKLEEEGVRLFSHIDRDYFTVLGLPLVELLCYLTRRGALQG